MSVHDRRLVLLVAFPSKDMGEAWYRRHGGRVVTCNHTLEGTRNR